MNTASPTSNKGPLSGIRVLDLSRVLAGPWCSMTLADLGADVIKVESPQGDDTRTWGPPFLEGAHGKMSAYFACCNRNKRSMTVDLHTDEGKKIVHELAKTADVVLENFKTGGAEKLGVGYDDLKAINPKLVYCSISGYGRTGTEKDRPGYDFVIQAETGLMSITGDVTGQPAKVGVAISDLCTGQNAAIAILAALVSRGTTGQGQRIDISLFDTQLQLLANIASNVLFSGKDAPRWGNAHANIVPYQAFEASDAWFVLAIGNDRQWQHLCDLIEKPEWATLGHDYATNPGRVTHRTVLVPLLAKLIAQKPADYWLEALKAKGVPCGKVHSMKEALERTTPMTQPHPTLGFDVPTVPSALNLSATPVVAHRPPPALGEHTDEIMAELGLA